MDLEAANIFILHHLGQVFIGIVNCAHILVSSSAQNSRVDKVSDY